MGMPLYVCPDSLADKCLIPIGRAGIEISQRTELSRGAGKNDVEWALPCNDDGGEAVLVFDRRGPGEVSTIPDGLIWWFVFSRNGDLCQMIGNILLASGAKTDNRRIEKLLYHCPYAEAVNWPSILTNRDLDLTTETSHDRRKVINTTEFPAGQVRQKGLSLLV